MYLVGKTKNIAGKAASGGNILDGYTNKDKEKQIKVDQNEN